MKLAIVNHPQLAVSQQPVTGELSRQSAVTSHVMPEGSGTRRAAAPSKQPALSAEQAALAKRMNVKDPAGANKRFLERQAQGKSSVAPNIAILMRETS